MGSVTVGLLGNPEYAKELGKKSTESDIGLWSLKEGDVNISLVVPIRYPEKLQSLAYTVASADVLLFVVDAVNKELGESILAADAAGHTQVAFVLRNYIVPDQLAPLLKGTSLQGARFLEDKHPDVRAALAALAVPPRDGPVRVPIDHHFEVKGIGPVVLGFVKQGTVKQHETLRLWPTAKTAQVRSIQVHDVDVREAHTGDHVGLALKNCTPADLDRGFVMAPEGSLQAVAEGAGFALDVAVSKWHKLGLAAGRVYQLSLGMQFVPVRLAAGEAGPGHAAKLEFQAQKAFAHAPGERGVLYDLDSKGVRVVGPARMA